MNNSSIVKCIRFFEIGVMACVVLICLYIAVVYEGNPRIIAIGGAVGVIIGCIIDMKIVIPKKYDDKDERTIIVSLLSQLFAGLLCFFITLAIFTMTVLGAIQLMKIRGFAIFTLCVILVNYLSEKISYKVINDKL